MNAIKLATSVGFSAVQDYTEVARQATRFATAGFTDVETSVKALTNLLNSYGLQAQDAGRVNDLLFRGFQVGGGSAQFFAAGLGTVASTVHAAGGSMEDLIATTALLSRAAAGNSRIFIEVQQAFTRLVSPTSQASRAMQQMGVAIARNREGGVDFFSTLEGIQSRIKELSGGDQLRAFQLLRNIFPEERSARAFAKLMSANADSIREVRQAMAGAGGSIADALTQVNARAGRQIEMMRAAWERLKISFGGAIAPAIAAGANALGNVFDTLQRKVEAMSHTGGFDRLARSARALMEQLTIPVTAQGVADFFERMVRTNIPNVIDKITDAAKRMRETLSGFTIAGAFDWLDNLRERGVTSFVSFGKSAIEAMRPVLSAFGTFADVLQATFDLVRAGGNAISAVWQGIVYNIARATAAVQRGIQSALQSASNLPGLGALGKAAKAMEPDILGMEGMAKRWGQSAAKDKAEAIEQFNRARKLLGDVFEGRGGQRFTSQLDRWSEQLDTISKDFGHEFLEKLQQLAPGRTSTIDAVHRLAQTPPEGRPSTLDAVHRLAQTPPPMERGTGVVVPIFTLDPRGARREAHERSMQARRDAFAQQYPGLARRTRPDMPSAGVVPRAPDMPLGAPPGMKGGRALMDLLGPTVREPVPPAPEAPSVRGGGSLLDLPPRGAGGESAMLDSAKENLAVTAAATSSASAAMLEVAELLAQSNGNIAQLQKAATQLKSVVDALAKGV